MLPVTATEVAEHVGRTLTVGETQQVNLWLSWVDALIIAKLGPTAALDQTLLGMVACEVVGSRLTNPEGATSREVAVDDGREVVRYRDADAATFSALLDPWWSVLSPPNAQAGAFTVAPSFQPDTCRAW